MKRLFFAMVALSMILFLSACGSDESGSTSAPPTATSAAEPVGASAPKPVETYDDVTALFANLIDGASVSATKHNDRIDVTITDTGLASEDAPENWEDVVAALAAALTEAKTAAEGYGCTDVAAQLNADDGVILASGFNGSVRFNKFSPIETSEADTGSATITKFEYDQILVGMTYSQVVEIVGGEGTLQTELGEAGGLVGSVRNYTWKGEGLIQGSATITFDDYVVYSKFQIGLT